ncbi:MAG: hypothetical protein K8T91_04375 [Planctomycetes bacterium]|nr:hypothetical protein [Planctomycetota bacterium]
MLFLIRLCIYALCPLVLAGVGWDHCNAKEKLRRPVVPSGQGAASREASATVASVNPSLRVWSDSSGRKITAELISFDGITVTLQKENGEKVTLALDKLSEPDRTYVKDSTPVGIWTGTSEVEEKCGSLCDQITKGYNGRRSTSKPTIAVVEFSDLSGNVSNLGRLLSEELITRLFATGNYKVIERLLLNKAIAEHKLQLQGLVDPKSAKELGKILGVDAIVSGTIAEVGNSMRVNARLISTETGEILSVAAVTMRRERLPLTGTGADEQRTAPKISGDKAELKEELSKLLEKKQEVEDIILDLKRSMGIIENLLSHQKRALATDIGSSGDVKTLRRREIAEKEEGINSIKTEVAKQRTSLKEVNERINAIQEVLRKQNAK